MQIYHFEGHIQTIYLAVYPEKILLLDGCCRCDIPALEAFLRDLDRSPRDIELVVVTHMHPDHAGGAHALRKRYGCRIASFAWDEQNEWYDGLEGTLQHLIDILLAHWVAHRKGRSWRWLWYPKTLKADCKLRDGDRLPFFSDWRVMETPGHTDHDISLLHDETETAYVADVVLKVRNRFLSPFTLKQVIRYRSTLMALRDLGWQNFLLAHGGPCTVTPADFANVLASLYDLPQGHQVFASIFKSFIRKTQNTRREA